MVCVCVPRSPCVSMAAPFTLFRFFFLFCCSLPPFPPLHVTVGTVRFASATQRVFFFFSKGVRGWVWAASPLGGPPSPHKQVKAEGIVSFLLSFFPSFFSPFLSLPLMEFVR